MGNCFKIPCCDEPCVKVQDCLKNISIKSDCCTKTVVIEQHNEEHKHHKHKHQSPP